MKLTIEMCLDNAAFGDDSLSRANEVKAIIAKGLATGGYEVFEELADVFDKGVILFDTNGNKVGKLEVRP